jgi:hypothetical protein
MVKSVEAIANPKGKSGERSVSTEDYEAIALLAYSYWQARGCPTHHETHLIPWPHGP